VEMGLATDGKNPEGLGIAEMKTIETEEL